MDSKITFASHDQYIASLAEPQGKLMLQLRETIKKTAPEAVEVMSYNMPAFKLKGRILAYFAAHTNHVGFYPASAEVQSVFREELLPFETSKGTVRFPLDKKLPVALVKKIIAFRAKQITSKK